MRKFQEFQASTCGQPADHPRQPAEADVARRRLAGRELVSKGAQLAARPASTPGIPRISTSFLDLSTFFLGFFLGSYKETRTS